MRRRTLSTLFVPAAMAAAGAMAAPAAASPLLLLEGGDTSVVVLDLGDRSRSGDVRTAAIYRGSIADADRPRAVTGEKRAFDCTGHRERLVASLARGAGGKTEETRSEGPWSPIAWKSPMDYALVAVCLNLYNREQVSAKDDLPSILASLEQVWKPGRFEPPPEQQRQPQKKRPWYRPPMPTLPSLGL